MRAAIGEGISSDHEIRVVTFTEERGRAVVEVHNTGCGSSREPFRNFRSLFTAKKVDKGRVLSGDLRENRDRSRRSAMAIVENTALGDQVGRHLAGRAPWATSASMPCVCDAESRTGTVRAFYDSSAAHDQGVQTALMVVSLGVAGCPGPSAPSTKSGSDATTDSEQSGRIRRTEDERARRREMNGDAGPRLPQEPMQTSP